MTPTQPRTKAGKALLRRNVLIENELGFEGRWVAIPREDFDAVQEAVSEYREALRELVACLRWEVEGHPVKYPIIPAGNGHAFSEAADKARSLLQEGVEQVVAAEPLDRRHQIEAERQRQADANEPELGHD